MKLSGRRLNMYDINKYIIDGRVEREKIAMDIKYRSLKKEDILSMIENSTVKDSFIGNHYDDKRTRNEWSKDYLDILSYAVVSESFNQDYLIYLNEVAEYVNKKRNHAKILIGFVSLAIVIVAMVSFWIK